MGSVPAARPWIDIPLGQRTLKRCSSKVVRDIVFKGFEGHVLNTFPPFQMFQLIQTAHSDLSDYSNYL